MPRAGLTRDRVVELSLELAATGVPITLGAVAAHAGVRTPSLYKHVSSAAELDSLVAEQVLARLALDVGDAVAGHTGTAAAAAALNAYRDFARAEPDLYRLLPVQPGNDPRLRPIGDKLMDHIAQAIGYPDADRPQALHSLRLIRAGSEGFIRLEAAGGFGRPADVEESGQHLVDIISHAVTPTTPSATPITSRGDAEGSP